MKPTLYVKGNLFVDDKKIDDVIPIEYIREWIKKRMVEFGYDNMGASVLNDRILIIKSGTGSGKSTAIPVELFRLFRDIRTEENRRYTGASIICTQPRILTAISIARDISSKKYNPDMIIGKTVGYQTKPFSEAPSHGLIYATLGTLTAQVTAMEHDFELTHMYRIMIIDEVHERSIDSDLLLLKLRNLYLRNRTMSRLPFLILMSATFDANTYAKYFNTNSIIRVEGHTYPITNHFLKVGTNNYAESMATLAWNIHVKNDDPYDVLLFVPGSGEMDKIASIIAKLKREGDDKSSIILKLKRESVIDNNDEYRMILGLIPLPDGITRRIIISTPVAETGVTIETLGTVIDSCWGKLKETSFPENISGLILKPVSIDRATQRRGRVGRLRPGNYFAMCTENVFSELERQSKPSIILEGCTDCYLQLCNECNFEFDKLVMLTQPSQNAMSYAKELAMRLGLIMPDGKAFTKCGAMAAACMQTTMQQFKMIISASIYNVSYSDVITCAMLCKTRPIDIIKKPTAELWDVLSRGAVNGVMSSHHDMIYMLLIIDYVIDEQTTDLLTSHKVRVAKIWKLLEARDTLISDILNAGVNILSEDIKPLRKRILAGDDVTTYVSNLRKCLYEGLKCNLLTRVDDNVYMNDKIKVRIQADAKYLITDQLKLEQNMRDISYRIEPNYITSIDFVPWDVISLEEKTSDKIFTQEDSMKHFQSIWTILQDKRFLQTYL